ncbi:MAG: hypothetical protein JST16_18450 [Bdellovibrionales bacterium]|nr:hypothetical protein [Bdellovibrionales bacterium]
MKHSPRWLSTVGLFLAAFVSPTAFAESPIASALRTSSRPNALTSPTWAFSWPKSDSRIHLPAEKLIAELQQPAKYVQPHDLSARVLVIDEESLAFGNPQALSGAEVRWVSPQSGLAKRTNAKGIATAPYPNTISSRFIVQLPGYLPAVGYVSAGVTTPVVMVKESRVGPILKTLGVVPDPERVLVIGKTLHSDLSPASDLTVDASVQNPFKVFYSLGSVGIFHAAAHVTGAQGDFLVSGFGRGLQYLMPSGKDQEWGAWTLDTHELPPFVTMTLADSKTVEVEPQIVDSLTYERPSGATHATIGGQRGLFVPNEDGIVAINELHPRGSADLVEVTSEGYLKTWVSGVANAKVFPSAISIFTRGQVQSVLGESRAVNFNQGMIFGNLHPETYRHPVAIQVYGPTGKKNREANVLYFDANNRISLTQKQTDATLQNFAVTNLDIGEWHLVVTNPASGRGLSIQTVRVEEGVVSQVQF